MKYRNSTRVRALRARAWRSVRLRGAASRSVSRSRTARNALKNRGCDALACERLADSQAQRERSLTGSGSEPLEGAERAPRRTLERERRDVHGRRAPAE